MAASYYFARQIGCGNWASVWIVQPKGSARGQVKAMKIVHRASQSGALQRFNALLNEYKVLAGMPRHPNIVCFEDLVLSPSYACLVMPFYDQPMTVCLPFAACRVYFARMAEAVEWLHKHYITHNDLKLANTLVNRGAGEPYGQPVLVDFGFARNHQPCYGTNFISNESWGTPEYLSPERSVGDAHDERLSDIWALGVSFFEMATGRTPFEKKNEVFTTPEAREEYYRRTIQGKWYTDYDLPFEIEDLCRAIVRVDPQARPRIPEILEHDFFQDAAATDSAGSSPRSI
ncbi:kinase-like protein, partial [Jaminaea rosea]